jgi:hypothetical protein
MREVGILTTLTEAFGGCDSLGKWIYVDVHMDMIGISHEIMG